MIAPFLECAKEWKLKGEGYACVMKQKWAQDNFYQEGEPWIDPLHTFRDGWLSFADYVFIRNS
jgi:hypothetical protein